MSNQEYNKIPGVIKNKNKHYQFINKTIGFAKFTIYYLLPQLKRWENYLANEDDYWGPHHYNIKFNLEKNKNTGIEYIPNPWKEINRPTKISKNVAVYFRLPSVTIHDYKTSQQYKISPVEIFILAPGEETGYKTHLKELEINNIEGVQLHPVYRHKKIEILFPMGSFDSETGQFIPGNSLIYLTNDKSTTSSEHNINTIGLTNKIFEDFKQVMYAYIDHQVYQAHRSVVEQSKKRAKAANLESHITKYFYPNGDHFGDKSTIFNPKQLGVYQMFALISSPTNLEENNPFTEMVFKIGKLPTDKSYLK